MRIRGLVTVLLLSALAAGGCAYNRADVVSSTKPDWVAQKPADTQEMSYFVGEGVGPSIVDTGQAEKRAMADVCRQIADELRPDAVKQAIAIADQKGVTHDGADAVCAACADETRQQVEDAMTALHQEGFYWERWERRDGIFHSPTHQYRYYILAGLPADLRDKLTTELVHHIADAIEARNQPASPAPSTDAG